MTETSLLPTARPSPALQLSTDGRRDPLAGDTPTFSSMVDRFGDEIYRYSCQLTRNTSDADDLYQETLLKAFRAFGRLPADANHRAWMYRITSNTFISEYRKRKRDNPMTEEVEMTLTAPARDIVDGLDARDTLRDVEQAVAMLPPKQRAALVLRKYHGHDYASIAHALNSTEVAARANVHEALRKLRAQFSHRLES